MDNKERMNMGSSRPTSVFVALDSLLDRINNKMNLGLMRGNQLVNSINSGMSKLGGLFSAHGGGGEGQSANVVMTQPPIVIPFSSPNIQTSASGQPISQNRIMANPIPMPGAAGGSGGVMGGNGGSNRLFGGDELGRQNAKAGAMTLAAFAYNATPETRQGVYINYMTDRALFYGAASPGGPAVPNRAGSDRVPGFIGGPLDAVLGGNKREKEYNEVSALQRRLSTAGTVSNATDVIEGMSAAQAYGLGVATPGYEKTMTGVMQMTNVMPGVSAAQAAQGFMTGMQNARSVNMLRMIGIQARDPVTGALKSPTEIADQIWNKMQREKIGKSPITERDLAISLQPGNSLDSMLSMYFGNDPVARKFVEDALYLKARGASGYTSAEVEKAGGTTAAIRARSERETRALQTGQQVARAQAGGQAASDKVITAEAAVVNALDRLTGILSAIAGPKAFFSNMAGAANGTQGPLLSLIMGLFKADGGPVAGKTPYIVGERGPELFVPKTDGVIVPNDKLNRDSGGGAKAGGADATSANKAQLYNFLIQQGFSKGGAEGVVGNLMHESGLSPTALGDKGTSYGIAQWHNGRWGNLKKFAQDKGLDPSSLEAQEQFLMFELKQKQYKGLVETLKGEKTTRLDAAAAFMKTFERPKDQSEAAAYKRAAAYDKNVGGYGSSPTVDSGPGGSSTIGTGWKNLVSTAFNQSGESKTGTAVTNNNNQQITINVTTNDPKKVAEEVKKILADPTQNSRG